ncbi:protein UXT-like [Xenopus laevis]|uniref:Protein UXT n=1 Tax=Xenopus laevis TaxID=8355 RepID=A0A8J0TQH7_XENLA|nr:protein UXT-like [Xenopus laevis]
MAELEQKVQRYESFVWDTLHVDLRKVLESRDAVYEKISQYLQVKNVIERLQELPPEALHTQVDLGCNFFVNAEVPDFSKIFLALGFGFYLELTLPEALKFIERKNKMLTDISNTLSRDAASIKAHIRLVLEGLRELQELPDDAKVPS